MEKIDGQCIFAGYRRTLGGDGAACGGLQKTGKACGSTIMISLAILYGLGGASAALLLGYLVYALFFAEEF